MPLEPQRLRYFIAIAETGSLSAAARRVHVAQPALSHHVGLLEGQLGVRLLTRHSRGVTLTQPGERLLEHARIILRQIDHAYVDMRGLAASRARRVTLGLLSAPAPFLIPRVLRAAAAGRPPIAVDIVEGDSELLRRLLRGDRLDLTFNLADPAHPNIASVATEALYLAGPSNSPVGSRPAIPFDEVLSFPLLLPGPQNSLRKLVEQAAARVGRKVDVAMQIDGVAPMRQAVSAGFGHTIISWPVIGPDAALGAMQISRIVEPELTRSFVMERASRGWPDVPDPALEVEALLAGLLRQCRDQVGWPLTVSSCPSDDEAVLAR